MSESSQTGQFVNETECTFLKICFYKTIKVMHNYLRIDRSGRAVEEIMDYYLPIDRPGRSVLANDKRPLFQLLAHKRMARPEPISIL